MKNPTCQSFVSAVVVALSFSLGSGVSAFAAEPLTEIPAGETFYVGGAGSDPYNTQGGCIILNAGSTLVVTQSAALTVWSSLIVTNGAATLEFRPRTDQNALMAGHLFVCDEGSLLVKGKSSVSIGHDERSPICDVENMRLESQDGAGFVFGSASTMLSFPRESKWRIGENGTVWLCGSSDMFPDDDEVTVSAGRYVLANTNAIPASKPIRVSGNGCVVVATRTLPDLSDPANLPQMISYPKSAVAYTNYNTIVFDRTQEKVPKLVFSNWADCVMAGNLSGYGLIEVSGGNASYSGNAPHTVTLMGDNSNLSGRISLLKPFVRLALGNANASGSASIEPAVADTSIVGMPGSEVSVDTGVNGCNVELSGGGTFDLASPQRQFAESVTYWFDFSRVDMYTSPGEVGETAMDNYADYNYEGFPLVERVVDWRFPDAPNSLWNRRLFHPTDPLMYDYVYGCRMNNAGASGNMSYLALPSGRLRRLPFSPASGHKDRSATPVQMAIMVFGSQYGGGNAIIGTSNGAFGRTGTTIEHGITTNERHRIWVDGVQVDPTAANVLNGDWQIITVSMDGKSFDGLGWNNYQKDSNYGGQCYGELLLFTEEISEVKRLDAEIYLAEKWGLSANYSQEARARHKELSIVTNRVFVRDGAMVRANDDSVELYGVCSGTVQLTGGMLTSGKRAMNVSEIPSEGRLFWLDADDESTVMRRKDMGSASVFENEIKAIRDKGCAAYEVGHPFAYGTGTRAPAWVKMSRNGGPVRGWVDFNQYYSYVPSLSPDGNNLRFFNYTEDFSFNNGTPANLADMPARTVFVVQDSFNKYASPLLDSVSGSNIKPRTSASAPIWPSGTAAAFVNGENRLNGRVVDQSKGFSQNTEVFTVRATAPVNAPFIEYYANSEKFSYEDGKAGVIGEMLYYSTPLSDETVQGIEAYLMKKWMNRLPPGFADVSDVAVSGSGTVLLPNADMGLMFSSEFTGVVEINGAQQRLDIVIDPASGVVSGSLVAPGATLNLPSSCEIRADFTSIPPLPKERVEYVLVECASLVSDVDWTFEKGSNVSGRWSFVKSESGNKVSLVFKPVGCRLIVR